MEGRGMGVYEDEIRTLESESRERLGYVKPNPSEPTHGSSRKQCMNEPEYELQIDEIVLLHTDKHAHLGLTD